MVERPNPKIIPQAPQEPLKLKIIVVGEQGVGKSCFRKQFAKSEYNASEATTIGSDFYSKTLKVSKGTVQFNLWDVSGDPVYIDVRNEFYKESQVLFVMYDITNRKSFDAIDMWLREVSKYGGDALPLAVIGNKMDKKGQRAITKDDAENWVKQRGFFGYYEVCASEGNGFYNLFNEVAN